MMATSSKSPPPSSWPYPATTQSGGSAGGSGRRAEVKRVERSFECTEDLWNAFQARAAELECGVDWLLSEAMKRLLESGPGASRREPRQPVVLAPPVTARPSRPAPPPTAKKKTTLPPIPRLPRPPEPRPSASAPTPAPPQASPPVLVLAKNGTRTPIDRDAFVIGRSGRDAHLVLRDPGVSRQHAIVERHGSSYVIVDMASTNGVSVNGSRISRAILRRGDRIEIGPFEIIVDAGDH